MDDNHHRQHWLDITATIGDGSNPTLAYKMAVHTALYAAQDLCNGPVSATAHPPKRLTEKLRRGLPLSEEAIQAYGEGRWPPPDEAFSLDVLPASVRDEKVKEGIVTWELSPERLKLTKSVPVGGSVYEVEVDITAGPPPRIRQAVSHLGPRSHVAGVPRGFKLLAATCGLYDGRMRFLPRPMPVDSEQEVDEFVAVLLDENRTQPLVAVAAGAGESEADWMPEVNVYAKEAFGVQHVAAVTVRGAGCVRELLGSHGLLTGSIKTYRPGFSRLDVPSKHPMTSDRTIREHERGRAGMLERWRKRLMVRDAWDRRGE